MYSIQDYSKFFGQKRTSNIFLTLESLLPKDLIYLIQYYDLNFILYEKKKESKTTLLYYQNNVYFMRSNKNQKSSKIIDITKSLSYDITFWDITLDGYIGHHIGDQNPHIWKKHACFDVYGDHYLHHSNSNTWRINNFIVYPPVDNAHIIFKRNSKLFTAKAGSKLLYWTYFNDSSISQKDWYYVHIDQNFPEWGSWSMFSERILVMVKSTPYSNKVIYFYDLKENVYFSLFPFLSLNLGEQDWNNVIVTKELIFIQCSLEDRPNYYEVELLYFKE